ncbi:MAG TPA: hypothetical protein VLK27_09510 [Chthoniobacterales bacterium]|nr:hypothetical protein [Chthoniobacterales bacterium]
MLRIVRIGFALLLVLAAKAIAADSTSVLFVGNSLTQVNDLPAVFKRFAAGSSLQVEVETIAVTPGGAFLSDHWKRGDAVALLREKHPNFLILQGQSTEPLSAPKSFSQSAALFKAEADRVGAKTVLFATWAHPASDPYYKQSTSGGSPSAMQAGLNSGYASVAKNIGAMLAPVGVAFEIGQKNSPKIKLLDGTQHPSPAGTYLAAAVLFRVIFNTPSGESTYYSTLPKETALRLQRVADEVSISPR